MSRPFFNQRLRATPMAATTRRLIFWGALAIGAAGCVLDTDDRCGPNQVAWTGNERCVCADGFGYTPEGCVQCGEHEVSSPAGCVCSTGFARSAAGVCAEIPEGIGAPCTTSADCLNPTFAFCQPNPLGGYCTALNCEGGCDGGYACNSAATPSFCQRPPVGAGTSCTSDADCVGTEALYCDTFFSMTCLVRDCSVTPNNCFTGSECCDLTSVGLFPLCIPVGACTI